MKKSPTLFLKYFSVATNCVSVVFLIPVFAEPVEQYHMQNYVVFYVVVVVLQEK